MKQENKDLIKGSLYLVGILATLAIIQYIFSFGFAALAFVFSKIYMFILVFIAIGFSFSLIYSLYNYKETYQKIKNINWRTVWGFVGGVIAFAAIMVLLYLSTKGFLSFDYSGKTAANLTLIIPALIFTVLFVFSVRKK